MEKLSAAEEENIGWLGLWPIGVLHRSISPHIDRERVFVDVPCGSDCRQPLSLAASSSENSAVFHNISICWDSPLFRNSFPIFSVPFLERALAA
jgi:hypothetical protein